jgi:predicted lysophospholipase L1 biosynthesis ABC-type transport system permease subunit
VAVVNRHLALRHYEHGDAIGRDIFIASGWPATPYKVVGIVEDEPSPVLGAALEPRPTVYLSVLQHPPVNAELLIEGGRQLPALEGMATDTAISQRALARREANPLRWFAAWFRLGGLVMLAIALLGTFTTLRMWVRSRAAELGLRRSVGATKLSVAMFVLRHAVAMAAGGLAIGLFLFAVIARPSIADLFADLPAWNGNVVLSLGVLLVGTAIASALLATWTLLQRPPSAILATSE